MFSINILNMLALVILCKGLPIALTPQKIGITTYGDDKAVWFEVTWNKMDENDEGEAILGYQVKVWKVNKVKSTVYKMSPSGELEFTEVERIPDIDLKKDASDEVTVIDVPANETKAVYNGVIIGETYEVGVQAYTKTNNVTQSYTNKLRVKLNP